MVPTAAEPVGSGARHGLSIALAVAILSALPLLLTGALAVQMSPDLDLDETTIGLGSTIYFIASTAISVAAGRSVDRRGALPGLRVACLCSAGALLTIGLLANGRVALWVALGIAGVGNAICQPTTGVLLSRTVPANRLALAFGLRQATVPLGALLGGLSVPVIALTLGWRWVFVFAGVAGTALLVVLGRRSEPPAGHQAGGPHAVEGSEGPEGPGLLASGRTTLVLLGLGGGFGAAGVSGLGTFLATSAVDAGIGESAAGLFVSVASAAGIVSRVTIGVLADRHPGRHLLWVAMLQASGIAAFGLLAIGAAPTVVAGGIIGYAFAWAWPGLFHFHVVRSSAAAPGLAAGVLQMGTFAGAMMGPLVFGVLAHRVSFAAAWLAAAALAASATTMVLLVARRLTPVPRAV